MQRLEIVTKLKSDPHYRMILTSSIGFTINVLYALGNFVLGIYEYSYWFINAGAYYTVLAVMRFSAVLFERKNKNTLFIQKFSGIMLIVLGFLLSVSVYLSVKFDVTKGMHEIIVITIATYTFTKMTLAIINFIKNRRLSSPLLTTLCNISLSSAVISLFSMQRSMLVSFNGMTVANIALMNTLTGSGVCLIVVTLGISMLIKKENYNG